MAKGKKKEQMVVARGKKKEAVARASISNGNGKVFINGIELSAMNNLYAREIIAEPLQFIESKDFDLFVSVKGGGTFGQAQAVRTAIARAIHEFKKDEKLYRQMMEYDRSLFVEDSRRVEPKKFKGPKARARFTKSYR